MGAKFTLLAVFFLLLQQTWTSDPIPDVNFINDATPNIWTDWSDWSECSRSCDGGISHQRRACRVSHCEGNAFRYKICNMQPCPDNIDFREKQCSNFNEIPYKGDQMTWKAYYHPQEPCALHCVNQFNDVELLAVKVHDGTRCRPGSLDMCIDGKCMPVGCDLEIGSTKTVDNCGVCGGNGKTCSLPLHQWNENTNTTCSLKCGGGYKITQPVCQNTATGDIVDQHLCDISQMPEGRLLECNIEPCPPKWEAGEWSVCSQSCGSGIKTRRLYCVEEHNKTKTKVFNHLCKGHKPRMQESCNMQPCPPEWITGQWSKCSATCGQGIQTRSVTCNKNPADMMQCDPLKKPSTEQKCFADTSCQEEKYYSLYDDGPKSSAVSYKDTEFRIQAEKLIGKQNGSPHAVFVAEEWGPCSVTCGEGFRKRKVYCKAHLDYMNVMTKFADDTCGGEKPIEIERCVNKPCSSDTIWDASVQDGYSEDVREDSLSPKVAPGAYGKTYSWVKNGFTPCTATCLGGVQELIVNCIRDDDKKVVSPYLCDTKTQPAVITQTCNDHPCPPRWNVSEYSPCNKKCGMGIQTREVNCIHEVTMSNTVAVPHNMCEQPPPPDRQHCNFVDCAVEWYTSNWTKCSKVCGGGIKTRAVECRQITAQDRIVSHPDHMCEGRKPQATAPCNGRPCGKNKKPGSHVISSVDNQFYNQVNANKPVSVKIGGKAVVFLGSTMRIKCPTKNFAKEQIIWEKDGKEIHNNGNYRVLKKRGILKIEILSYSDNATFTCKAGPSSSSLIVHVKPPPGKLPASSEESAKQNNQLDPAIPMEISGKANFELSEDISHERLSEYEKNQRKYMQKKPTTPKILPPVGATTNEMVANQGTKHQMVDSLLPSGTSSGSRLTPFFFGILINLKRFWSFQHSANIRSQRMLMEEPEFDELRRTVIAEQTTTENLNGTAMVLGKGERDNVKFEWFITSWSNCSPPCGGTGFQIRAAQCMVKVNNITQNVESNLCEDAGLPTPTTIQKCDTTECPHWITKDWQDCNSSRCFAWNTAMQKRDVFCQLANGTLVPDALCESSEKPITKQECYNDLCKGTWKVGDWTECYASCDKEGVKYRILQCVWYGTKKPAGTACRDLPRPAVMRTCRGISCAEVYLQRTNVRTGVDIVRM
ncbi:protein madd-4 isoform X2 [Planococcus citri]|uniref:protein madd-4 isoform X2 n=1 Tax=Planococcus citri TaxID=170843 RepID=UPI0031FA16B5